MLIKLTPKALLHHPIARHDVVATIFLPRVVHGDDLAPTFIMKVIVIYGPFDNGAFIIALSSYHLLLLMTILHLLPIGL